ncbi:MAG: gamma-glutamyl-gamma-aminobutyrate hydrolase family protein, partial [Paludibacter sp.]|nr:gamma-glutamyl-gamma-aminobutyrate hydrolase family protein [Paludibacter sp.]
KLILSDEITKENVEEELQNLDGIVVAPGFGHRGIEGKIEALHYARVNDIPCLGICMGMQSMCIEFARNVLGYADANTTEIDPNTAHNVVDMMEEQKTILEKGASMRLGSYKCHLKEGTKVAEIYNTADIAERHRHRYEFNNKYKREFEKAGIVCSGINSDADLVEIIELPSNRWYIGTQFHPEYRSTVLHPHPLFIDFIKTAIQMC